MGRGKKRAAEEAVKRDEAVTEEQQEEPGSSEPETGGASSGSSGSGSELESSSGGGDGSSSGPEVSEPEDGEDSPDEDPFDKIDVNFQFFDPKESDFHGLKALLHAYLDGTQYASSPLVEAIIQQASVGTVVRTGEDEDPIGIMTVLNTRQHADTQWMRQIKAWVLGKVQDEAARQQLAKAWDAPDTGLLLNERLINSPPQLAPPLVQALFDEVAWATEDEPTQERRDAFKLRQYILLSRVYADPLPEQQQQQAGVSGAGSSKAAGGKPPSGPKRQQQQQPAGKKQKQQANEEQQQQQQQQQQPAGKKQKQQANGEQQQQAPVIVYVRPEDEFFHRHASLALTLPVEGRAVARDELRPMRLLLLLQAGKVAAARSALDAVVGNMAAAD